MGADETVSLRLCFCFWCWALKFEVRQLGRKGDKTWGSTDAHVRMRQKLQGCLVLRSDSQLPTSLQVCDAGDLQDKPVTLSHGEEGTWPGAREADIGGDLAGSGGAVGAPQQPAETPDLQ